MADLKLLAEEWRNKDDEDYTDEHGRVISMKELKARLLKLKDTVSYRKNWYHLATRHYPCHAHNLDFIAALLYLVDERTIPVSDLQPTIHLHVGHIYRSLKRGGVLWRAHYKGIGSRLREDYYPWRGSVYVDPLAGVILHGAQKIIIPHGVDIYKDVEQDAENENDRGGVMGLIAGKVEVPLPLLPSKPPKVKRPPHFPDWRERLNG